MIKILITGAEGQLGKALVRRLSPYDKVQGLNKAQLDIRHEDAVYQAVASFQPDLLINAAAYTEVEYAEQENAYAVNVDGAGYLANAAQHHHADFIHFSTDYVFNGQKNRPYTESDVVDPLNGYGQSKCLGEAKVLSHCPQAIIIRTSWIFGEDSHSFPQKILQKAKRGEPIFVVADQIGGPTYVRDLAHATLRLYRFLSGHHRAAGGKSYRVNNPIVRHGEHVSKLGCDALLSTEGIYHFSGYPYVSWYDFARYIVSQAYRQGYLSALPKLYPITSAQAQQKARRPRNSCLDNHKIQAAGVVHSDWQKALNDMSFYL